MTWQLDMICNAMYNNAEGYVKVMWFYFCDDDSKPFYRDIMRYCEIHAKKIAVEDTNVGIQVLS
jgi:hypothetical protein